MLGFEEPLVAETQEGLLAEVLDLAVRVHEGLELGVFDPVRQFDPLAGRLVLLVQHLDLLVRVVGGERRLAGGGRHGRLLPYLVSEDRRASLRGRRMLLSNSI